MKRRHKAINKSGSTTFATDVTRELEEQIRLRAYELYDERGREDGRELEDWLQAEAEARQTTEKTEAA